MALTSHIRGSRGKILHYHPLMPAGFDKYFQYTFTSISSLNYFTGTYYILWCCSVIPYYGNQPVKIYYQVRLSRQSVPIPILFA